MAKIGHQRVVYDMAPVVRDWVRDIDELCAVVCVAFGQTVAEGAIVGNRWSKGSPVDTGFLRASWRFTIGAAPKGAGLKAPKERAASTKHRTLDPSGARTLGLAVGAVAQFKPGQEAWLGNDCGYVQYVEQLHPTHAGWVRILMSNGQAIMDDIVYQLTGLDASGNVPDFTPRFAS